MALCAAAVAMTLPGLLLLLVPWGGQTHLDVENPLQTSLFAVESKALELLIVVGLMLGGSRSRWESFGLSRGHFWTDVKFGVAGFGASLFPVYAINGLIVYLDWQNKSHPFLKILTGNRNAPALIALISVIAVVLAPLVEELLFRVVLQGWLEEVVSPRKAILIVAVLFAAVHGTEGRLDFLPLFPLALILGYIYRQTHSLVAVVTTHACFNGFSLLMILGSLG